MNTVMDEPQTLDDWQDVADLSTTYLALESARQYGLIEGGPEVNVERCEELLAGAAALGIEPRDDAIERCLSLIYAGAGIES